ncbi:MAG: XkdX family protein [Candidatus Adiutrix sp.]|jgi:uncharacterized XkdX family phage protein|nr:XkdX family protein [Candidatus Adiutrix sp.]
MNFDLIKQNYNKGLWTKSMVALAVKKGVITQEEYAQITGDEYA